MCVFSYHSNSIYYINLEALFLALIFVLAIAFQHIFIVLGLVLKSVIQRLIYCHQL